MARAEAPHTAPTRTIVSSVDIHAPVADIWRALTEAREIARWFAPEASGSGEPGGTLILDWGRGARWNMPVITSEPNKRLVVGDSGPIGHERRQTGEDSGAMRIEYALESLGGGITRVTVTHSGFGGSADWNDIYDGVDSGWFYELRSLKHYVEKFLGRDRRTVCVTKAIAQTKAQAWDRLIASLGLKPKDIVPGATVSARLRAGGPESLVVLHVRPMQVLSGFIPGLGDAMVRFGIERCAGIDTELWVWLSAHNAQASDVEAFERDWTMRAAALAG